MISYLKNIDRRVLNLVNRKFRYGLLDKVMPMISALGNYGIVWLFLAIYLIINKNCRTEGYMVIMALIITTVVGEGIIKHLIKRTRPFTNLRVNKPKPVTYSFPSGHTASSFAVAGIFIMMDSKLSIFVAILAALISFSRVYLNVHYPSDVVIGVILGLLCSRLVIAVFYTETAIKLLKNIALS